jgi:hypothetical protein
MASEAPSAGSHAKTKMRVPLNLGPAQASLMQVNLWEAVISARPSLHGGFRRGDEWAMTP